ncbi:hypothetical protein PRIPAC_93564 [Pristionchus pacificus]|uniref:Uncharacterized protein n=1 Tax=Pristionchus pacificus TaxID=54126 RepID=A0A2A6CE54_PRIPA|nr:hypothetical protein PRIPAC_93564 [Pristionchus pacificus]|eukprot:PDM76333.1 hypothetical protein PRIPAC_39937 [Pristionchus pacificus]
MRLIESIILIAQGMGYGKIVICSTVAARLHGLNWCEMKLTMIISTLENLSAQLFEILVSHLLFDSYAITCSYEVN